MVQIQIGASDIKMQNAEKEIEKSDSLSVVELLDTTKRELENYKTTLVVVKELTQIYIKSQLASGLSEFDVSAKLIKGYELGLKFGQSFDGIDVIQGHTSLKAQTMYALILSRCKTAQILIDELSPTSCRIRVKRNRYDPEEQFLPIAFTLEDAKKKSYVYTKEGRAKPLKDRTDADLKENWKDNSESMLFSRVISRAGRWKFADVIQNMYTSEEVQDFDKINRNLDNDNHYEDEYSQKKSLENLEIGIKANDNSKKAIEHPVIMSAEDLELRDLTKEFCDLTKTNNEEINTILEYEFSSFKQLVPKNKLANDMTGFKIQQLKDKLAKLKKNNAK